MNRHIGPLIAVLGILLALFAGWQFQRAFVSSPSSDAPAAQVAKPSIPVTRKVSVLFIGNSYTYVNSLPEMVISIASSDPGNSTQIEVASVTRGGAKLNEWDNNEIKSLITSKHCDYVVLQNQSEWALFPDDVQRSNQAASDLAPVIKSAGGTPVLYMTWMRKPGTAWYSDGKTAFMHDPEYMHRQLHDATAAEASAIGGGVVSVGDVWAAALAERPSLPFYAQDGSHPGPLGTYLAALMFYHYFTNRAVDQVTYVPEGVDAADAAYVKAFVDSHSAW